MRKTGPAPVFFASLGALSLNNSLSPNSPLSLGFASAAPVSAAASVVASLREVATGNPQPKGGAG